MREDNFIKWLRLVSSRPHALTIFLRRLFTPKDETCSCRADETMYGRGNINSCVKCADAFCTLDTHDFLGNCSTAILGWLTMIIEGIYFEKYCYLYF